MLRPFSGEYAVRTRGGVRGDECVHCGRPVKEPFRRMVEVLDGGGRYARTGDDPADLERRRADQASYMGLFPVGPECRKVLEADGVAIVDMKGGR
jgi:hypothetical protein